MADVVLGCDSNGVNDSGCQNTIAQILEKAGHKVEKLGIAPGPFANYSYSSKAKGKIGVYLMAASLVSYLDGANSNFKYCYFGIRGDVSEWGKEKGFKSKGVPKDHHGDCPASLCDKWAGKTYPQLNESFKNKVCATYGATPKELGENIVKAMGGEVIGDSGGSDDKKKGSAGNIKESIQKLLKHWDGEVECYIKGDEVHINKIREPSKYYVGVLQEGVNVFSDSISLTDVNSNTPNILEVQWTGGTIVIEDESLIKRFGEIKTQATAVRKETVTVEKKTSTNNDDEDVDSTADNLDEVDYSVFEDSGGSSSETKSIPIDNYNEALKFAEVEWNKLKRDNGRQLELQTLGSTVWKSGEWVRVILPTYSINGFMYIVRTSQSLDSGDWTSNISLVDYPPGWGKEEEESSSSSEDSSESSSDSGDSVSVS